MANQLENIAGLQSILETVNSLPEAGSGGGVNTCVFTNMTRMAFNATNYWFSAVTTNGVITELGQGESIEVVCPSIITIREYFSTPYILSGGISSLYASGYDKTNASLISYLITEDASVAVAGGGGID